MQVDLESRSTGTTSIAYKYKAKYSQHHKSKTQLQEGVTYMVDTARGYCGRLWWENYGKHSIRISWF